MTSRQLFRTILFAGSCLILAACGDSTAPKQTALTVDSLLAELDDAQTLAAPALSLGGGFAPSATASNRDCPFNSSNQRFVCDAVTVNGLTINRFYQLLDASNAPLSSFDVTKVAAIRNVSDVTGTLPGTTGGTITAHEDGTLSGLLSGTHTLNSTGTSTATIASGGQTLNVTSEQTVTNLVLPRRGSPNQYPQSGTIAMKITSGLGAVGGQTVNITMTFNGTSKATFTMAANGFTQTCTIDLAKQGAAPVCS